MNNLIRGGALALLVLLAPISLASNVQDTSTSPATGATAVTPSDSTVLSPPSRAIYVGVTGDLKVRMAGDGTTVTFSAVPAGSLLPFEVDMVFTTGTTASSIVVVR